MTTPDSPAPFSSVTAAKTTPTVNAAISAARDLPGLVNVLQVVDPGLAKQLEGTTLATDPSVLGTVFGLAIGWAIPHYGLACTAATVAAAGCWTPETVNIATGAGAVIGVAVSTWVMRMIAISPIAGIFSKGATPVEQVLLEKKVPGVLQPSPPAPAPVVVPPAPPIPVTTVGTIAP